MSWNDVVAVLLSEPVALFEMAVPCEVFGVDRSDMGVPSYRLLVCGARPGRLRTGAGFTIDVPHGLRALSRAGTVIVPGWPDVEEDPAPEVLAALRRAHRRGARIASLCTGAFVLAAAGLLDGRRATTHWMHAEKLAARYPAVEVDAGVLYVDEGSILTSAGTAAGIDLCLHLVRRDHGAAVANVYARRMVVPPHRDGGQAQFVEAALPAATEDARLSQTLEWALDHLAQPLTVESLARRAVMSPRTFARRFRQATGTTPLRWLLSQRVLAAQRMLETTGAGIEEVAGRCGFGSPANLRVHFTRTVGTSPTGYRQTFQAKAS